MTCSGSALRAQQGADGSFSLYSARFSEGFHGPIGALSEAAAKFVAPAQLERFPSGQGLTVLDVGFGLGTNSAALLEAAQGRGLSLRIHALELDPEPLRLALKAAVFRRQWHPATAAMLEQLLAAGRWCAEAGGGRDQATLHWGDARQTLPPLLEALAGQVDLVLLDAFSPQRCPELWSQEFLGQLARLLAPQGRLLTYCCAAAVRRSLQLAGLQLASIRPLPGLPGEASGAGPDASTPVASWSYGTAASPTDVLAGGPLQPLSAMELEHLTTRAAEPYRDPSGQTPSAAILAARRQLQASSSAASTTAWRRRWGLEPRAAEAR